MLDDGNRVARGHYPVRPRLDGSAGIGIDDYRSIWMLVAERTELVDRRADVERAFSLQRRHDHRFLGIQNFCRLAHETNAGDDESAGRMPVSESRHFQRVGNRAARFLGQVLYFCINVIVRYQDRIPFR